MEVLALVYISTGLSLFALFVIKKFLRVVKGKSKNWLAASL